MDANQTCEILLGYIKKSNLNWSITESPFSLSITLKKSFIKNKDGSLCESGLEPIIFNNKQGKPSTVMKPSSQSNPSSMQQQSLVNPFSTKNTKLQQQALKNYFPTKSNLPNTSQQQIQVTQNQTNNTPSFSMQQQQQFLAKDIFPTYLKQQPMINPYPTQNRSPSSLKQQSLKKTSPTSYQELALDNHFTDKSTFSSSLQERDMANPYQTKHSFPSNLNLMNPYPTKTAFSTSLKQEALLNPNPCSSQDQALTNLNLLYSEQKTLDPIPLHSTPSPPVSPRCKKSPSSVFRESFPFQKYPLEYSDDEDYSVQESVYEFKKRLENSLRKSREKATRKRK